MSVISLRLPDKLLHELDNRAQVLHIQRAEYIRKAIEHMNNDVLNKEREQAIIQASLKVRKDSLRINKEFSDIEHDPEL